MVIEQCHMIMDGVNNLLKKWVSCKDNVLAKSFRAKNISDVENMGNRIEDLCNEELDGEMSYIFEDGVEGSIGESRFDSMNEEGNEKNIVEGNEEVGNKENFEWNKEDYNQGNAHGNDDAMHGHGVQGTNLNIVGKRQYEWWGVECDLVDDGGVFITKGWVVACDPYEAILDDRLREDHVGPCILYYLSIVLTVMTIWKWSLV